MAGSALVLGDLRGYLFALLLGELAVDRAGRDAEELRREALVAAGVAERLVDGAALDLSERRADGDHEVCAGPVLLDDLADPFAESLSGRLIRDALDGVLRRDDREALSDVAVASYWVAGAEEWRTAGAWPPPYEDLGLYLAASSGGLGPAAAGGADTVSLAFDPEGMDACDMTGTTAPPGATFTSEPLEESIDVVGAPALEITVSTDLEDADVTAWLYEAPGLRLQQSRSGR